MGSPATSSVSAPSPGSHAGVKGSSPGTASQSAVGTARAASAASTTTLRPIRDSDRGVAMPFISGAAPAGARGRLAPASTLRHGPLRFGGAFALTLYGLLRHLLFAAALSLLSALLVWGMIRFRVVLDHPDARKAHLRPIPKGGGVGIVVAFLVGVAILYRFAEFSRIADPYFRGVILAATAIAGVAFLDDIFDWPFIIKLAAQLFAALLAVGSGLFVREFHLPVFGTVDFGWLGSLATLFWILFVTNAMNFIDGLDGLAGGVALIAAAFLAGIAASQG